MPCDESRVRPARFRVLDSVLNWQLRIVRSVSAAILIALVALSGLALVTRVTSSGADTEFLGHPVLVVSSGSMEPTIPVGSIMVLNKVTPAETLRLQVGDIVTFSPVVDASDDLVTHRIIDVRRSVEGVRYVTKGDANPTADLTQLDPSRVVGVYAHHFALLGRLVAGFTRWHVIVLVITSLLLAQFGLERRPIRGTLKRKQSQT